MQDRIHRALAELQAAERHPRSTSGTQHASAGGDAKPSSDGAAPLETEGTHVAFTASAALQAATRRWAPWLSSATHDVQQAKDQDRGDRDAGRAHREQARRLVGPAPQPPAAPQGVYVHGSVGSGKSMLMDLFYGVVREHALVPLRRRVHFNAAILEVNARLHAAEAAARERAQASAHADAAKALALDSQAAHPLKPSGRESAAADSMTTTAPWHDNSWSQSRSRPVFVPSEPATEATVVPPQTDSSANLDWGDSQEARFAAASLNAEQARRNKDARLAVMAARRRLRQSRSTAENTARLAASNAPLMEQAARSLMRASDDKGLLPGEDEGSGGRERRAGVLCFDEMQARPTLVSDRFTEAQVAERAPGLSVEFSLS